MLLRIEESVDDGAGVVAFEPAVGGRGAFAGAMGAGVHHDDAVTGAQEKFGLADDADAVIGDPVKKKHPASVGPGCGNFPAAEHYAVGSANVEVLAMPAGDGEGGVRFADEAGSQFAADGVEVGGADQPAGQSRQERREEQKDESNADQAAAHVVSLEHTRS